MPCLASHRTRSRCVIPAERPLQEQPSRLTSRIVHLFTRWVPIRREPHTSHHARPHLRNLDANPGLAVGEPPVRCPDPAEHIRDRGPES